MVSTKFYCGYDEDIYLSAWADSGSMSVDHIKQLELEFLDAIVCLSVKLNCFAL